jgi:hypothetical protein
VAGIGTSIVSDDDVAMLGKDINNLAFALVAPLQSDNTDVHVNSLKKRKLIGTGL